VRLNSSGSTDSSLGKKSRLAPESFVVLALLLVSFTTYAPAAHAQSWTESFLYSFCGKSGCADGEQPQAGLIQGKDGNFYGTNRWGGANPNATPNGPGTIFQLTPSGTLTTIYTFCSLSGCADGASPYGSLIQGSDGNFYGTTLGGGVGTGATGGGSGGTVFQLKVSGTPPVGTVTTLYSFCSLTNCADGQNPGGSLIQGTDSNFYGTTAFGGANGAGTVFQLKVSGTPPTGTLTYVYSFCSVTNCTDGDQPEANVIQGTDGNFYGTTLFGGASGNGNAFQLKLSGTPPTGTLTNLWSFCSKGGQNCTDGISPSALIQGTDQNFYGTTAGGGNSNQGGTAFKLTVSGTPPTGTLTNLYPFCNLVDSDTGNCDDGNSPEAALVQGTDGNFYGTTTGGAHGIDAGALFKLTPSSTPDESTLTILYSFCSLSKCADGSNPIAPLIEVGGSFYGTTEDGGANGASDGTVFKVSPPSPSATATGATPTATPTATATRTATSTATATPTGSSTPTSTATATATATSTATVTATSTASTATVTATSTATATPTTTGSKTPTATATKTPTPKEKDITVSPKNLGFGNLAPLKASAPSNVTIHNPNSASIEISSVSSSNPEFVPSTTCVGTLAADSNCEVSVVFTPSSDGKKSAKLTIGSSASKKSVSVKMKGEGKGAPLTATATPTRTATPTPTSTAATATPTATATPPVACKPLPPATTTALWVSDSSHSRVLKYLPPLTTGMSASVVLGQPNFTTANQTKSAAGMDRPETVAFDNLGNLWSSDYEFVRVLEFSPPFATDQNAASVIGEPNFTTFTFGTVTASDLSGGPVGIAFDTSCNLWVADFANSRVVKYKAPLTTGMSASLVLGQSTFTSGTSGSGVNQLKDPQGIAFDPNGDLWVADYTNNRVLEFVPPFSNDQSAAVILGNNDTGNPKANTLSLPFGVSFDAGGNLWVVDGGNNRTLEFKPPFSTGMSASVALGQPNLTSNAAASTAAGERGPGEAAFDSSGNLFVADASNNRVLEYKPPFTTGMAASIAIGQPNLTSSTAALTASGLSSPIGVSIQP